MLDRRSERSGKKNLMTAFTKAALKVEVINAEQKVKDSKLEIGKAAGSESDWHDNAAFDHANMAHDLNSSRFSSLKQKLLDVEIITPRLSTEDVGLGNDVVIKFAQETESETVTVLGPDDARRKPGWISYESPLGQSIMGKKKGEMAVFKAGSTSQSVKILDIFPGNF